MPDTPATRSEARRNQILAAAFDCFLRYGYSKVTMLDVAKAARISRPSIYILYRGKEELFLATFASIFADQLARVEKIAASRAPIPERLRHIFNIIYVELWDKFINSAEGNDLLDATRRLFPKIARNFTGDMIRIVGDILGDPAKAELLLLSGKGLSYDRPDTKKLRTRLYRLIDSFAVWPASPDRKVADRPRQSRRRIGTKRSDAKNPPTRH